MTNPLLQSLDFTYDKVMPVKLGIGAGVPSSDGNILPYTSGVINSSSELYGQSGSKSNDRDDWRGYGKLAKMPLGKYLLVYNENIFHIYSRLRILDAEKIRATLTSSRLDPNDPRNIPLLQLLRSLPTQDSSNTFRLTRMDLVCPFVSQRDFLSNPTLKHFEERLQ